MSMGIIDVVDNFKLLQKRKANQPFPVAIRTENSCRLGCMPDAEQIPDAEDRQHHRISEK
jgi:hypothetical protein